MSPKRRLEDCVQSHSQSLLRVKSDEHNFPESDRPESILHRLRPRIGRRLLSSEMVYKARGPRKRRKRDHVSVKKSFIDERKRHVTKNRYLGASCSHKSTGDVTARTIRTTDTSVEDVSISFVQMVKDYIYSTIKKGTRWASNYVYQTFVGSETKFNNEIDKRSKRSRAEMIARGDGCGRNTSGHDFVNLEPVWDARDRQSGELISNLSRTRRGAGVDNGNGNVANKMCKKLSPSRSWKRKKGRRRNKWIVRDVIRYKKIARRTRKRHAEIKNRLALVNRKKTNLDIIKFENVDDSSTDSDVGIIVEKKGEDFGIGEPDYLRINNQLIQITEKERMKTANDNRRLNRFEDIIKTINN